MATAVCATTKRAPGPRGHWLLGHLSEFRRDPLEFLVQVTGDYGDIVRIRFGPLTAHVINHPEYLHQVLEERYQNYDKRTRSVAKMRATCGASLLTEDGPNWLRHRRLVQPAMLQPFLGQCVPIISAATESMLTEWRRAAQAGRPIEIVHEMMRLTIDIAAHAFFGEDLRPDAERIEESLSEILMDTWRRVESIVDLTAISSAFHRPQFLKAVQRIDAIVFRMLQRRRSEKDPGNDLLGLLLRANDCQSDIAYSDQELRDIMVTMLLAGHETTANALAWAFALVAQEPHWGNLLADESHAVLGSQGPTTSDLEQLSVAKAVFAETVRLYPSIWIMERRVVTADELGGYRIPARSMLLISPYALHRHPQFWPEPEKFDPLRFMNNERARQLKHAYIPFGFGPHQCIGRAMATLVATLVLSMITKVFRLRPETSALPVAIPGITLRQPKGLRMIPIERDAN